MERRNVSVILPAYNEAEGIRAAVLEIDDYLKTKFSDYEIIVVSEGSTDNTEEVLANLKKEINRLKSFCKKEWAGMAGAVRTGFKNASKDLIFYTDADRQFDITELEKILPWIPEYDIVTGFKIKRGDPIARFWASRFYNFVMRLLFGISVRDINCAFKLYKKEVVKSVDFLPTLTEGTINAEVYISAMKHGYKIKEVPVHHYPRQTGSPISEVGTGKLVFVKPSVAYRFLKDTLRLLKKVYIDKK